VNKFFQFADIRLSRGNDYESNGFAFNETTKLKVVLTRAWSKLGAKSKELATPVLLRHRQDQSG
jgi:hypothetical protein